MYAARQDDNRSMNRGQLGALCVGIGLVAALTAYAVALTLRLRRRHSDDAEVEAARDLIKELQSKERWLSAIVDNTEDLIVLIGADLRVKWTSPWVGTLFGVDSEVLVGRTTLGIIHPQDRSRVAAALRQVEVGERVRVEYRTRLRASEEVWLESTATNRLDDPDIGAIITVSRDVTDRHRNTLALAHRAAHDPLTGLLNRSELETRLAGALERTSVEEPLTLAFIDIDHFKAVNDLRGHGAGDRVLQAAADAIRAEVRGQDIVSRLGGDELVVALVDTDVTAAESVVERIRSRLKEPIDVPGEEPMTVTVSIGLAPASVGDNVSMVLHRADQALYQAKRQGRDRHAVYCADLARPPAVDLSRVLADDLAAGLPGDLSDVLSDRAEGGDNLLVLD